MLIVTDQIAHQNIDHIIVYWNSPMESRHGVGFNSYTF
jgi:hypothetical protein